MSSNGRGKVLVIASEPDFLQTARRALEPGYEISCAQSDAEGLEKARKEMPQAIVLGYLAPRGASFELHRKLRHGWITKNIPLLVVDEAGDSRGWTRDEGLRMDADGYVSITRGDSQAIAGLVEPALLQDRLQATLKVKANALAAALLDPAVFCVTWEQIPGRGAFEMQQEETMQNVEKAAGNGKVHAVSVTDNPGGSPAISTEMLCAEIKKRGIEPLVHLACRDKNRNELESVMYGLAAAGVRNFLLLTGDHPASNGFNGRPKGVFDLDPIQALQLVSQMNRGLEHEVMLRKTTLAATDLFAGACVSPFKKTEAELIAQYSKLRQKVQGGARFIISQVGYDARKMHELLQWLKVNSYDLPVLANIYVLSYPVGRVFNANQVPGCVVTDKLLAELAEEARAKDKGRSARLLRAARMYALAKGMGFAGVHIGGNGVSYKMVEGIIDQGEELARDWPALVPQFDYPQKDGFYFFEKDAATGLNLETPAERTFRPGPSPRYRIYRTAHSLLFNEKGRGFKVLQAAAARIDSSRTARTAFGYVEHLTKVALFGCMNCGDCALVDTAYLCPMSQCPKNQRNGPCGGSYDGWCEVYPNERKCIWVKAYGRLRSSGRELKDYIVPPCNWELWETPSWLNYYLGRDHTARRLGISPPESRPERQAAQARRPGESSA